MTEQSLPWDAPDWLKEEQTWIRAVLDSHGIRLTGNI